MPIRGARASAEVMNEDQSRDSTRKNGAMNSYMVRRSALCGDLVRIKVAPAPKRVSLNLLSNDDFMSDGDAARTSLAGVWSQSGASSLRLIEN